MLAVVCWLLVVLTWLLEFEPLPETSIELLAGVAEGLAQQLLTSTEELLALLVVLVVDWALPVEMLV